MNRTDRLYALVEELRARAPRPVRASDLAERFEVSVRTIERDLGALLEAGVPLWATRGPNGGYALDPTTTLLLPMRGMSGRCGWRWIYSESERFHRHVRNAGPEIGDLCGCLRAESGRTLTP